MKRKEIKNLDKLWSQAVRKRDKFCQKCAKTENLHSAHIYGRRHRSIRWDLLNGITLCVGCHLYWAHKEAIEFTEFVKDWMGATRFNLLKRRKQKIKPYLDYETIKFSLEDFTIQPSDQRERMRHEDEMREEYKHAELEGYRPFGEE